MMEVSIQVRQITFIAEEKVRGVRGEREDRTDLYCCNYPVPYSRGFGEFLVGHYVEKQVYKWIQDDYKVTGGNQLGKYLGAEEVI